MPVTNLASPCLIPGFFFFEGRYPVFLKRNGPRVILCRHQVLWRRRVAGLRKRRAPEWTPPWIRSGKAPAERDTFSASGTETHRFLRQAASTRFRRPARPPHKTRTLPTASTTFLALADDPTASPSPRLSRPRQPNRTKIHRTNSYIQLYKGFHFSYGLSLCTARYLHHFTLMNRMDAMR